MCWNFCRIWKKYYINLKNKFNNIKSIEEYKIIGFKIIDTYDLLHLEFNEKIIIGRINKEGKTCYGDK